MDPLDFRELFTYNHTVRQNYINTFKKTLSWELIIKNQETGWQSLKDTLLHIIWVEDSWINYSIQGLEDPNRPFPYSKYNSWKHVEEYNLKSISKVDNYLSSLTAESLYKPVSRLNKDGIRRNTIAKEVLIHVFTEELHHRGEIIAILWQMDIQPPDMGWLSVMKKTDPIWIMK
ncbi:MAG: DinB family protein [Candidatus Nitrosocosmicus sp.]